MKRKLAYLGLVLTLLLIGYWVLVFLPKAVATMMPEPSALLVPIEAQYVPERVGGHYQCPDGYYLIGPERGKGPLHEQPSQCLHK